MSSKNKISLSHEKHKTLFSSFNGAELNKSNTIIKPSQSDGILNILTIQSSLCLHGHHPARAPGSFPESPFAESQLVFGTWAFWHVTFSEMAHCPVTAREHPGVGKTPNPSARKGPTKPSPDLNNLSTITCKRYFRNVIKPELYNSAGRFLRINLNFFR